MKSAPSTGSPALDPEPRERLRVGKPAAGRLRQLPVRASGSSRRARARPSCPPGSGRTRRLGRHRCSLRSSHRVMTTSAPKRPTRLHSARCARAPPCMLSVLAVGAKRRAGGRRGLAGVLWGAVGPKGQCVSVQRRVLRERTVGASGKSVAAFRGLWSLIVMAATKPSQDTSALAAAPLLDAAEAGRLLSVPASWVLAEARADRIPHVRLGRYVRFSATELEEWWRARMRGPWRARGGASRTARSLSHRPADRGGETP